MFGYALKRAFGAIPTLFIVIVIAFLMVRLTPGNPFAAERALPETVMKTLMHQYNLDLPIYQQFWLYIKELFSGNLGMSYKNQGMSISQMVFPQGGHGGFFVSAQLGFFSLILAFIIGTLLGIWAALTKKTKFSFIDNTISAFAVFFISTPIVVTAPLAVLIFAVNYHLLPANGWGNWNQMILPVMILAIPYASIIAQIMRSSLVETLHSPFIRTAKAKGLSTRQIIFKHAFKSAIMPVISFLGPAAAGILTGSVIIEQVYTIPGIGIQMVQGATNRDYNLVLALTIIYSALVIIFNLIVDIIYGLLDPKIKY
ncbi:ABC transporter permease subunit [Thiotrichales bacterium 19S9-12]|nr:ABC transporter permease subunit [Thiotrichales bacterium 19S9-11]MCF6810858.1 ABC transporter permease subunit [Thiotrichales bacterium 19S9-12]